MQAIIMCIFQFFLILCVFMRLSQGFYYNLNFNLDSNFRPSFLAKFTKRLKKWQDMTIFFASHRVM